MHAYPPHSEEGVDHPLAVLEGYLNFYRFALLLLPSKDLELLGSLWVALKAAHEDFQAQRPVGVRGAGWGLGVGGSWQ